MDSRRFTRHLLAGLLPLLLLGCSDDSAQKDAGPPAKDGVAGPDQSTLKRYGDSCAKDAECQTGLCLLQVCTVKCTQLADCPSVGPQRFDCGEAAAGVTACYPQTYGDKETGKDCSAGGKCAAGHLCAGQPGDTDRYCAAECSTDRDCPPRFRCASTMTGKTVDAKRYCRKRLFCHPCVIDDQCGGAADRCVQDGNGNLFCSLACSPTAATDGGVPGTCPSYGKCTKEGSGYQCQHKTGACYKSLDKEGEQCDPCIVHGFRSTGTVGDNRETIAEVGQCKAGNYCVEYDTFHHEAACLAPCSKTCTSSNYYCKNYSTTLGGNFCYPVDSQGYTDTCFK